MPGKTQVVVRALGNLLRHSQFPPSPLHFRQQKYTLRLRVNFSEMSRIQINVVKNGNLNTTFLSPFLSILGTVYWVFWYLKAEKFIRAAVYDLNGWKTVFQIRCLLLFVFTLLNDKKPHPIHTIFYRPLRSLPSSVTLLWSVRSLPLTEWFPYIFSSPTQRWGSDGRFICSYGWGVEVA